MSKAKVDNFVIAKDIIARATTGDAQIFELDKVWKFLDRLEKDEAFELPNDLVFANSH